MSQRNSTYARKERDLYETPEWVTQALLPFIPARIRYIWEPACGSGKMVSVLMDRHQVRATDIHNTGWDFLTKPRWIEPAGEQQIQAIVANPPYELASQFIERALQFMKPDGGLVAMLLRTDFDHAQSRTHLFRDCPAFAKKLVLMRRIV